MKYFKQLSLHWILAFLVLLFQSGCTSKNVQPLTSKNAQEQPNAELVNSAIDKGFTRWSSAWFIDRYIPNSARVIDENIKDGSYVFRGSFGFIRGGSSRKIPFNATFTQSSQGYKLAKLCYKDTTNGGNVDCTDPSKPQNQVSLVDIVVPVVVILGVSAAIAAAVNSDSSNDNHQSYNYQKSSQQLDLERRQDKAREENKIRNTYDFQNSTSTPRVEIPAY